ncbi:MAG: hypothetical protein Q8M31_20095 [Beijerinckiaceae bacterium]|nr:hypothetical protein [Beijerinckiaceae bacterium]
MDRRILLRSLFALGGAATVLAIPKTSQAASLFDELDKVDVKTLVPDADFPAEGAEDAQMRQRCTWRVDRSGRRVQVCRPAPRPRARRCTWRVDRFGRRVQVCR